MTACMTSSVACTSRACCTSSWFDGAAPRVLVWLLACTNSFVYLVGVLWQWPVATILLAAICQDGVVKHAIVSLAPGCCSL